MSQLHHASQGLKDLDQNFISTQAQLCDCCACEARHSAMQQGVPKEFGAAGHQSLPMS